jgi:mannose-6-phosphate isomerase-like protein (cupin superfamily)
MTAMIKELPTEFDAIAPDGSEVRLLLGLQGGSVAHFALRPHDVSVAVRHRSVDEIWYFVGGVGDMWLSTLDGGPVAVCPGTCVAIPSGTSFQFRSTGDAPLQAIGVTMPPWPGPGEAIRTAGPWTATVQSGPGLAED